MAVADARYQHATVGGVPVLRFPALDAAGVDAAVTSRHGGVSEGPYASLNLGLHVGDDPDRVVENRRRAAGTIGLGLDHLVVCRQTHGAHVATVGVADRGRGARSDVDVVDATDALVTTDADVGLVVMVADCVPIVLVDPDTRALACVHAGWRGTVAGVTTATVGRLVELGAEPGRLVAAVGPAIAADRYQVGPEVVEAATAALGPAVDALVAPDGTGRWTFDVQGANLHQLRAAGVPPEQIAVTALDTGGDFFSDRAVRPCGRFAALARLRA
jgi:hypothetical protein